MTVISVEALHKAYGGRVAVEDVGFQVEEGEIFGLVGPNGAGKTTTVECLQGLRAADGGSVSVLGMDPIRDGIRLRKRIGSQLQESALPDRIRVWEALELFASFDAGSADWRQLMERWGLSEQARTPFAKLSGGQRQRLLVALALVNRPSLVFLDEMTTGLDPAARRLAWQLIREIRSEGTTVVMVTHFMDEADALCDRIAVVSKGSVIALDTPEGLKRTVGAPKAIFSCRDDPLDWIRDVPHVLSVERYGPRVEVTGEGPFLTHLAAALLEHGIVPQDLRLEQPSLEDAFLLLTGGRAE
jgi:ABC-2 type transport system ATP-binding protein